VSRKAALTILFVSLFLVFSRQGQGAQAVCDGTDVDCQPAEGAPSPAAAGPAPTAGSERAAAEAVTVEEGVTVSPARTVAGMDAAPPAELAHYVDPENQAWMATFGTEAGRQLIEPRQAPGPAPAGPVLDLNGNWRSLATSGSARVVAMAQAPDGRLFAAIAGDGLRVYGPGTFGAYSWSSINAGGRGGLASDSVADLAIFEGELWVATGDAGISILDLEAGTWRTMNSSNSALPVDHVNSLTVVTPPSGLSYIWIGTQAGGAARYGYNIFAGEYLWHLVDSGDGLPDDGVRDIAVVYGSETRVYFSTDNGLARLVGTIWTYYHGGNTGDCGLAGAWDLEVDHDNNLWIAASQIVPAEPEPPEGRAPAAGVEIAIGVCRHRQGFLASWELFDKHSPGLATNRVGGFSVDHAGRTWMAFGDYEGDTGGAAVYDQGTWLLFEPPDEPLQSSDVNSVYAAGESVWFGDGASAAFAIYTPNWLHFNRNGAINTIFLEADDAWVGAGDWLAHHDGNGWTTESLSLFLAEIKAIARGGDGLLYVGTSGEGIYPFSNGTFGAPITTGDGLPSDDVRGLARDENGRLWAATGGGLALQADGYWLPFTAATSELLSDDVRDVVDDGAGHLWSATAAGISMLDISAGDTGKWEQQTVSDGLPSADVRALTVDPDGHVWAATPAGLAEWLPESASWQVHDAASGALPGDDVLDVASDPVGRIWAGTASGLALYEADAWQHFHVTGSTLAADRVTAVASDGERLWTGAATGVAVRGVLVGPIGFYIPEITSFTPTEGAPGTTVTISGNHFDDRGPEYNTVRFCCFSTSNWPHHEAHVISASSTELVVQVPPLVATGPINVEAHGLTSEWSTDDFELAPVITDIGSSCVALGGRVDIYGAGFMDGGGAAYVKIGDGPERIADYTDPNVVRQFIRPDDTAGPIRVRLGNGNAATSSKEITISRPELAGVEVQQAVEGMTMVWGKRTLVQVRLTATGGLCPAQVDGGKMMWRKTNNTTQPAAFAHLTASDGLSVSFIEQEVSLDTTVNFVADFGYDGIFPLSQLDGAQLTLKNGPVELMTINVGKNHFPFVQVSDQVAFTLMRIAPANSTWSGGPTFWDMAWESMADVARVYPQRDIGWRWGSGSWIHSTPIWHSYGMVNLDTDDYGTVRDLVHDYVDPGGNNQAMAMVDEDLYFDPDPNDDDSPPSGKATIGFPTAVTFNENDDAAPTFLQEAIHAVDWVQSWSPNHDGANEYHSRYDEGETTDTCMSGLTYRQALLDQLGSVRRVVRLRWNEDPYEFGLFGCNPDNMPRSAMSYVPGDNNGNVFLEPYDYNYTLISAQSRVAQARTPYTEGPTLRLSGNIDLTNAVSVRLSYLEPAGEVPSSPAAQSDYTVQIRADGGDLLHTHPFPANFETTHDGGDAGEPRPAPFNLRVPFPDGAARAEIRHGSDLLWAATISANAPTVAFTSPGGGSHNADETVPVAWTAADGDGDELQFRLEYSGDDGATWELVAPYLTGSNFDWVPGHVPAGSNARLRLQVSDGFHTASAVSEPFTLTPAPPWAMITTPAEGAVFPEGKTLTLAGSSTTSQGPHTGDFRWTRTDEPEELGTTDTISYTLGGPGTYLFEFEVTAGGMSATDTVSVTVVADYDHDGMPNDWELQYNLNPLNAADALEDPDEDGLFNTEEYRYGTNPRVDDSDGDGDADGEEVDAGVDPTVDTQTVPDGPVLAVGAEALGYEANAGDSADGSTTLWVTNAGTGEMSWSASADANWLSVTPGSGSAPTEVNITASPAGLSPGTYNAQITFTAAGAADSPQVIPVTLVVQSGPEQMLFLPMLRR